MTLNKIMTKIVNGHTITMDEFYTLKSAKEKQKYDRVVEVVFDLVTKAQGLDRVPNERVTK